MKEQRVAKRVAMGKPVDRGPTRAENKMKDLASRTRQELTKMGKKGGATKQEINEARRRAKKAMREAKRAAKWEERGGPRTTSSVKLADKLKTRHKVNMRAKEKNAAKMSGANATPVAGSA